MSRIGFDILLEVLNYLIAGFGKWPKSSLDELELLKLEIRLCVEMKLVSLKKQALLSELLDRIGKQVTGWRNASR
ncbi:hypothetical protein TUM19329_00370 [Legionella antarctica]|uniref:Uncharacterized protein n=1 Tax=Legionella antarctica TaxID=2708020 RepID=A0A6F8T106_9GAMM|nr:hypothetical protein [Legionella antarctica]BCA93676.1 hypothetical protein TUM19329_00370 [Legionella antarctica]